MSAARRRSTAARFLRTSAQAAGGLTIAFYVGPLPVDAQEGARRAASRCPIRTPSCASRPTAPSTVLLAHAEMGQGMWTGLVMLLAEELDLDWSKLRVEHAPAAAAYAHTVFGIQMTGGSTSIASRVRPLPAGGRAGAHAARAGGGAEVERAGRGRPCRVERGSGRRGHAARVASASWRRRRRSCPAPRRSRSSRRRPGRSIGKPRKRLDSAAKVQGRAGFGMDVQFPGLHTALVARSPYFGGTRAALRRRGGARRCRGVKAVVQVPSGVAVVAENFWAAKLGRDALDVEWDPGDGRRRSTPTALARSVPRAGGDAGRAGQGRGRSRGGDADGGAGGRGRVRLPLPRARADGAAQLHRPHRRGQVRDLDGHAVPDRGPGGGGRDHGPEARAGGDPHPVPGRRLRPARHAHVRLRARGRPRGQGGGRCRSRWCGRARTTCAAATTGRCSSTR